MIALNTRPDTLEDVDPKYLFTSTVQDINYNGRDRIINRYTLMAYMQYIVRDGADADLAGNYWLPGATKGGTPPLLSYYEDYYKIVGVGLIAFKF